MSIRRETRGISGYVYLRSKAKILRGGRTPVGVDPKKSTTYEASKAVPTSRKSLTRKSFLVLSLKG
jgi:hypothetical protein